MKNVMTEKVPVKSVPSILATAILRTHAKALGIETSPWPEKSQFDLTSSATRAFMSSRDQGKRRRDADADNDAITSA